MNFPLNTFDPLFIYNNNFPGLQLSNILCLNKVKGTRLRSKNIISGIQSAKTKGPEPIGIFKPYYLSLTCEKQNGKSPLYF